MNETKIAEVNTLVRKNSRTDLIRLCKEKNLNCSGTKHDMAVRLIGGLEEKKQITDHVKKIVIRRNQYGEWEYEGLIFDDKTKNVVGRRYEEGDVKPLQRQDIEKCKQYKFRYTLPQILDERHDVHRNPTDQLSSDEEEEDINDDMEEEEI
jgi:hypothetical protein